MRLRLRGPEALHPLQESPLPRSPLDLTCQRGAPGHHCPPALWERAGAAEASPATCRVLAPRLGAMPEAVPTRLMQPGRHSPGFSPPPEPRLLAKAAPATPTCRFPTTQRGRNGKPKKSVGPGPAHLLWAPATLAKCACRQRQHLRCRRPLPLPGRTPKPRTRIGGTTLGPPYPTEDQKCPAAKTPRAIRCWCGLWQRRPCPERGPCHLKRGEGNLDHLSPTPISFRRDPLDLGPRRQCAPGFKDTTLGGAP